MAVEMKNTGIEWIGKIPEEWTVNKIKYSAILKGRIGWQGLTAAEYKDEGPYLITGIDFEDGSIDWEHCEHVELKRWAEDPYIQIVNGDLLITKDGTVGKTAIVNDLNDKATLNSGVLLIRTDDTCNKRYLYWILNSQLFWKWFNVINSGNSTIIHLYQGDFNNFVYPVPDKTEQKKIADFLDKQTSKIDAIIKTNEEQLEVLKKYKKSLITQTVTKGLNKNVKMKDSGIDWIGQIPEGWEMQRMKYILVKENPIRVGPFGTALTTSDYTDDGKWVYNQRVVLDKNFFENDTYISEQKARELKGFKVYPNDILITTRGTIGKVAKVPVNCPDGVLHPCIIRFRVDEKKLPYSLIDFLFNQSDFILEQITRFSNATTIDVIYSETLKNLIVPIIPEVKLKEILVFLSEKCIKIDSLINEKQQAIEIMQKYKKSLIYEYVTGKKRIK